MSELNQFLTSLADFPATTFSLVGTLASTPVQFRKTFELASRLSGGNSRVLPQPLILEADLICILCRIYIIRDPEHDSPLSVAFVTESQRNKELTGQIEVAVAYSLFDRDGSIMLAGNRRSISLDVDPIDRFPEDAARDFSVLTSLSPDFFNELSIVEPFLVRKNSSNFAYLQIVLDQHSRGSLTLSPKIGESVDSFKLWAGTDGDRMIDVLVAAMTV